VDINLQILNIKSNDLKKFELKEIYMFDLKRTKIILDGKIVKDISNFNWNINFSTNKDRALITLVDERIDPFYVKILGIILIKENEHKKDIPTIVHTQIICETIKD